MEIRTFLIKSMPRVPYGLVGCGASSAALLVLSFPAYSAWGLAFVGLVPLLVGLAYARSYRDVVWIGASCMVGFVWFGFSWISFVATNFGGLPWIVGKAVLLAFSLFGELQFLLFSLLAYALFLRASRIRGALGRDAVGLVAIPLAYVGLDFLYPKIFPNTLGHVLDGWFPVAQVAEDTGVFALTFPVVVVNVALAALSVSGIELWRRLRSRRRSWLGLDRAPGAPSMGLPTRSSAAVALAVVFMALLIADGWGRRRIVELQSLEQGYRSSFKVSLIQANIGDVDKLASEKGYKPAVELVLNTYRDMSLERVRRFHPDLLVWPETAYPYLYTHFGDERANRSGAARDQWVADLMKELQTPLLFGTYSSIGRKDYNSAFLIKPSFELAGVYRKSVLLAFGEYVPLGPLSSIVQSLVPTIADFGRGPGPSVMELGGVRLGPQICYEGIFPDHSRHSVQLGAQILLNITNDSWFGGSSEPWLHLLLTAFRSIELRRPLIRATNTGFSTVVDRTGEMRWTTRLFEPATLDATIRVPGPGQPELETFYLRHGEIFAGFCSVVTLVVALWMCGPALRGRLRARKAKPRG